VTEELVNISLYSINWSWFFL